MKSLLFVPKIIDNLTNRLKFHSLASLLFIMVVGIIVSCGYLFNGLPKLYFGDISAGYSWDIYVANCLKQLSFPLWNPYVSAQSYTLDPSFYNLFNALLYLAFDDLWVTYKLVQVLQFIIAGLCMYLMSKHFIPSEIVAVISGLNYMSMPFFLSMLVGHIFMAWSYTLMPLVVLMIDEAFKKKSVEFSIIAGMVMSLVMVLPMIEYFYLSGIPLLFFTLLKVLSYSNWKIRKWLVRNICIIFIVPVVLSGYYMIPVFSEYFPYSFPHERVTVIQSLDPARFYSLSVMEAFTFQYKEAMRSLEIGYVLNQVPPLILFYFLALSVLAIANLLLKPRDKNTIILLLSGLLSTTLSMGPDWLLFSFFHKYFPYFGVTRTPDRFLTFACLSFSYLASLTIEKFAIKIPSIKAPHLQAVSKRGLTIISCFVVILSTIVASQSTVFYHTFQLTYTTQTNYPDLQEVQAFMHKVNINGGYRVLDLTVPRGGNPSWASLYSMDERSVWNKWELVDRFIHAPGFAKVLGEMNIRYIITSPSWSYNYPISWPHDIEEELSKSQDFHVIYKSNSGITIWENKWALPRFYLAKPAIVFGGPNSLSLFNGIEEYNSAKSPWAMIFANQANQADLTNIANQSDMIIFHNVEPLDIAVGLLDSIYVYNAHQYAVSGWQDLFENDYAYSVGWKTNDPSFRNSVFGQLILSDHALYTSKRSSLNILFNVRSDESYGVWVRAYCQPIADTFSVSIDDQTLGVTSETKNKTGFRWIHLGNAQLLSGNHKLELDTMGEGVTILDLILITPLSELRKAIHSVSDFISMQNSSKLYLLETSHYFTNQINIPTDRIKEWNLAYGQGSLSLDTETYKEGNGSVKLSVMPQTGGIQWAGIVYTSPEALKISREGKLSFWFKSNTTQFSAYQVKLGDVSGTQYVWYFTYDKADAWKLAVLPLDKPDYVYPPGKVFNMSAIKSFYVVVQEPEIPVAGSFWVNGFHIIGTDILNPKTAIDGAYYIFENGDYMIGLQVNQNVQRTLSLQLDGASILNETMMEGNWLLYHARLTAGWHSLKIINHDQMPFEIKLIYILKGARNFSDMLNHDINSTLNWMETAPSVFKINISQQGQGQKPLILVNTESYSPQWVLFSNAGRKQPIRVNYMLNGYFMPSKEESVFSVSYTASHSRIIGAVLSSSPFFALLATFLIKYRHLKASKRQRYPKSGSKKTEKPSGQAP